MTKISEFRYEIPSNFAICEECWEEDATHWGLCASCYWKKELDSEAIQSVWDCDIPELLHTCHESTGTCKRCAGGYNYSVVEEDETQQYE